MPSKMPRLLRRGRERPTATTCLPTLTVPLHSRSFLQPGGALAYPWRACANPPFSARDSREKPGFIPTCCAVLLMAALERGRWAVGVSEGPRETAASVRACWARPWGRQAQGPKGLGMPPVTGPGTNGLVRAGPLPPSTVCLLTWQTGTRGKKRERQRRNVAGPGTLPRSPPSPPSPAQLSSPLGRGERQSCWAWTPHHYGSRCAPRHLSFFRRGSWGTEFRGAVLLVVEALENTTTPGLKRLRDSGHYAFWGMESWWLVHRGAKTAM